MTSAARLGYAKISLARQALNSSLMLRIQSVGYTPAKFSRKVKPVLKDSALLISEEAVSQIAPESSAPVDHACSMAVPSTTVALGLALAGFLSKYDAELNKRIATLCTHQHLSEPAWQEIFEYCLNLTGSSIFKKILKQAISADPPSFPDLQTFRELSPENFALYYEQLLSQEFVKRQGAVYTPPAIAAQMVKNLFEQLALLPEAGLRILDPACGSGIFVILCLRELHARGWLAYDWLITAVDRDSETLEIARILSAAVLFETGATSTLRQAPQLLFKNADFLGLFAEMQNLNNQRTDSSYDLIIGNPPYGLSRDDKISASELKLLQKTFQSYKLGKVNKYLAFMIATEQLLKPGGLVSLLVPNSWLGIRSAAKLRELWLKKAFLKAIWFLPERTFEKAAVETIVYIGQRDNQNSTIQIQQSDSAGAGQLSSTYISAALCQSHLNNQIPRYWQNEFGDLLERMRQHCRPLSAADSCFIPQIALQAYARGKGRPAQTAEQVAAHCFHAAEARDASYLPYLIGSDVQSFNINWSGQFLAYGPWLAEFPPLQRYQQPRVLVREITAGPPRLLMAAYTEETYLYNRSLLHVLVKPGYSSDLGRLLSAILNSALASFYLLINGRKAQRALFPKIVLEDLNNFPVPVNLAQSAQQLLEVESNLRQPRTSRQSEHLETLDEVVFDIYGFNADDRKIVRDFLRSIDLAQ